MYESAEALAMQAITLARNEVLVSMRFMAESFARLTPLPAPSATLACDGRFMRFDPATLARAYAEEPAALARAQVHMVLHCVFLHFCPGAHIRPAQWDTACDIVVEATLADLDLPACRTKRSMQIETALARVRESVPLMTAEAVYRYLGEQHLSDEELGSLREPFYQDDHAPWHTMAIEEEQESSSATGSAEEGTRDTQVSAGPAPAAENGTNMDLPEEASHVTRRHASHRGLASDAITQKEAPENAATAIGERFANTINLDRSRGQWQNAALEMGVQLDSYVQLWGAGGSNLSMNLRHVTRERHDYRAFLRKFARMGEHMRINNDEFDYVYYCFGLAKYGNLPLIEPLEYTEERRIRDFVIAIDTSSSTKDGLVRRFIEKTYAILADETSFFAQMNVLIIQCDAALCDVTHIRELRDLERYLDTLQIHGLGGTDFRPVFAYVDSELEQGNLTNLAGVIYFTDGHGTFPKHRPAYDTAFVLMEDPEDITVPPWAMKVVLEEEAILQE